MTLNNEEEVASTSSAPLTSKASVRAEWQESERIKRKSRHIYNKLHSIAHDSHFISHLVSLYPSLLVTANLRCGAWYTDPTLTSAVSYFKSTDGHTHQWSFSLKRSNLHLLPPIVAAGGAMIVDSTRRGKSMPDALSKTIPAWCAVLNEASHGKYGCPPRGGEGFTLETPEWMIPPSEHSQIESRIGGWAEALLASDLEMPRLEKSLRPVFVIPQTDLSLLSEKLREGEELEYVPLMLVSASRFVADSAGLSTGREDEGFVYVQGAGDDHENWARGLTPDVFWKHKDDLLGCEKERLEDLVDRIVAEEAERGAGGKGHWFTPLATQKGHGRDEGAHDAQARSSGDTEIGETGVFIGSRTADHSFSAEEGQKYDLIIHFMSRPPPPASDLPDNLDSLHLADAEPLAKVYPIHLSPNRKGLQSIRNAFPPAISLAHRTLSAPTSKRKILVCCQDGRDLSGSLVVAILASLFTDSRTLITSPESHATHLAGLTKDSLQRRLQWLVSSNPRSAPSRAFLLRVNELLLSPRHRPAHAS